VSPTANGAIIKNYRLFVGKFENQSIKIITIIDGATIEGPGEQNSGQGFIQLPVGESPVIVLVTHPAK
jgi:hypothetical protein